MNYDNRIFSGFAAAWEMLVDYKLPGERLHFAAKNAEPGMTLLAFPLVGVVLALLPVIIGNLAAVIFNKLLGAAIFALLAGIVLYFKDSGRGVLLMASGVANWCRFKSVDLALANLRHDGEVLERGIGIIFITLFIVIELALLFMLGYWGAFSWLILIMAGGNFVQGVLALQTRQAGFPPLIPNAQEQVGLLYTVSGVLGFILLLMYPHLITILVLVGCYYVTRWSVWFLRRHCGGVSGDLITLVGSVTESVILFCGLGAIVIG